MTIRIFITGGTFDKEYNELTGKLNFNDSNLPQLLEMGRCKVDAEIRTLMMVDSLEMTDISDVGDQAQVQVADVNNFLKYLNVIKDNFIILKIQMNIIGYILNMSILENNILENNILENNLFFF